MRIAFVVGSVFPAISETFIISQIAGLIKRGHEVDIYAEKPDVSTRLHPDIKKYNILERTYYHQVPKNYLLRLSKGLELLLAGLYKNSTVTLDSINPLKYGRQATSLKLLYQVSPHLDKQSYDIVHCHFGYNGLKSLQLRNFGLLRGKLITTFHGLDLSQDIQIQGKHIYDRLFEQGDLFLPVSEYWKQKLIELGCDVEKIIVHRMGIDCNSFSLAQRRLSNVDKIQLVSVSRLTEKKGLEYGVRAVAELVKTKRNIEYNIIGDGPLKEDLQQLIQTLKISNNVRLIGWRQKTEVIDLLKNSDIFLSPSVTSQSGDQEGIPVALMEAMAIGLPVISTFHSGIPELVKNNISGFLVPERDVQSLLDRLNYLIEHPEIRSRMGRLGHQQVRQYYDVETLNDRLVELYNQTTLQQREPVMVTR